MTEPHLVKKKSVLFTSPDQGIYTNCTKKQKSVLLSSWSNLQGHKQTIAKMSAVTETMQVKKFENDKLFNRKKLRKWELEPGNDS